MKTFTLLLLLAIGSLPSLLPLPPAPGPMPPAPRPTPPNIVLIFMDDMGYGDLSCFGATGYQTPHIDRLAAEGMRFTNFLSAQPVCTASRAGLLTGCYPNRIGMWGALYPRAPLGIHDDEVTLAELLKRQGYATAIYGKWHLGDHPQFRPARHGFDEYTGILYSNDMWPVFYDGKPNTDPKSVKPRFPDLPLMNGSDTLRLIKTLDDQAGMTALYTQKAVEFIRKNRRSRASARPFFLYWPSPMPHVPIAASERFRGKTQHGLYGDVLTEIDWAVGEILNALKENGLEKNTLVILTSDNGPWQNYGNHAGSTGGLREGKGTTFEGGNRVPCIMRWPGTIPSGRVCNSLASTIDIYPTIAKAIGAPLPDRRIDGVDLTPLLNGQTDASPRQHFYYYFGKNNLQAVRRDHWKLVLPHPGRTYREFPPGQNGMPGKTNEKFSYPLALYNLHRDPGERYDVQNEHPEIVAELQQLAEKAREDLGDDLTSRPGTARRPIGQASVASAKNP